MNGKDLNEFITRSANGDMYVLVTTIEYPNGLLRGQVVPVNNAASSAAAVPVPQPGPAHVPQPAAAPMAAPAVTAAPKSGAAPQTGPVPGPTPGT